VLEAINFIRELIRVDIILAFGLYSILFFITRLFFKDKSKLNKFDQSASQLLIYTGIAYSCIWFLGNILFYSQLEQKSINSYYWFLFWVQPFCALIPILLLKINFLRKSLIYRLVLFLYFLISFEQYVILVTYFHRNQFTNMSYNDYGITTYEWIIHPIIKVVFFAIIVTLFKYLKQRLNSTEQ
jgi:hypothetical protein